VPYIDSGTLGLICAGQRPVGHHRSRQIAGNLITASTQRVCTAPGNGASGALKPQLALKGIWLEFIARPTRTCKNSQPFVQGGISLSGNPQGPASPALDRHGPGQVGSRLAAHAAGRWSGVNLPQDLHVLRQFPVGIRRAQLVQHWTGTGPGPKGSRLAAHAAGRWSGVNLPHDQHGFPFPFPPAHPSTSPSTRRPRVVNAVSRKQATGAVARGQAVSHQPKSQGQMFADDKTSGCPPVKPSYPIPKAAVQVS
jgi:hypothetical protein